MSQHYFAVISPGLESALADELKQFRARKRQIVEGGVSFETTNVHFYRMMLHVRLASRVYLRIDSFRARDPHELYRKSRRIDWSRLLKPEIPVAIEGHSRASKIFGSGAVADRVRDAIADAWQEQGVNARFAADDVEGPSLTLLARLDHDQCTLRLDASGQRMDRRGWRLATGHAPLRENVAAALLQLAGWAPGTPLLDPMCGSGTFLIEAARSATHRPPRDWASYGFHQWAHFDPERWADVVDASRLAQQAADAEASERPPCLFGNDQDDAVVAAACENAARAEVDGLISFSRGDALALEPPCEAPGLLICNPPYGARLARTGPGQSSAVEQGLIDRCAEVFGGWTLALLLPSDVTPARKGLDFVELARFRNGGIPVRFWSCQL